jgi:thymidine phosphorylase
MGLFQTHKLQAMSMAIFLNGMIPEETVNLTEAMTTSGDTINWAGVVDTDLVCDKHSTGGVGDKTSLILAPILAGLRIIYSNDFWKRSWAYGWNVR